MLKLPGAKRPKGWFDMSTLKEPYRVEGKKTLGYELAEQLDWQLPDVILYPTGGGTGLIGMWKAFDEMEALGWIGEKRPRMFSVQAAGCAPIVRAFEAGETSAVEFPDAHTCASGLRVPKAVGDFLMLRILRESGGGGADRRGRSHDPRHSRSWINRRSLRRAGGCSVLCCLEIALFFGENRAQRARRYLQHWLRDQIPRVFSQSRAEVRSHRLREVKRFPAREQENHESPHRGNGGVNAKV